MAGVKELPATLMQAKSFSRKEYINAMMACYNMTEAQIVYDLQKRVKDGTLLRTGWGQYALQEKKILYTSQYSKAALQVVSTITDQYEDLDFQVFELVQLNTFMNHLFAHNTIFVYVENDLITYVFDTLWKTYPGRVLLKPSLDEYYRYLQDDEIIVSKLPSQSPKGYGPPWKSKLEKILVDISADKLVSKIIPNGEKRAIFYSAFHDYQIDKKTILRYAKRKGVEQKIQKVLDEYERTI